MSISIGQKGKYLYKQAGDAFTVDAEVTDLKGAHIQVQFINPNGLYRHSRWLRTPSERARFTTDLSYEVKRRGAPQGNQYARKEGHHRIASTLSFSDTRLERMLARLSSEGKEANKETIKKLAYDAIDAYLS